jgi:hypothetical protein
MEHTVENNKKNELIVENNKKNELIDVIKFLAQLM